MDEASLKFKQVDLVKFEKLVIVLYFIMKKGFGLDKVVA